MKKILVTLSQDGALLTALAPLLVLAAHGRATSVPWKKLNGMIWYHWHLLSVVKQRLLHVHQVSSEDINLDQYRLLYNKFSGLNLKLIYQRFFKGALSLIFLVDISLPECRKRAWEGYKPKMVNGESTNHFRMDISTAEKLSPARRG